MGPAWVGPLYWTSGLGDTAASFPAGGGTVREAEAASRTVVSGGRGGERRRTARGGPGDGGASARPPSAPRRTWPDIACQDRAPAAGRGGGGPAREAPFP